MPNLSPIPPEDSIRAFVCALSGHSKVHSATRRDGTYLLDVVLRTGTTLLVQMTNIYVVGTADVIEVLSQNATVGAIVTLSAWNMVSSEARDFGRGRGVGVFTWREMFGALNYKKYWLYEPIPLELDPKNADRERHRRRRAWN